MHIHGALNHKKIPFLRICLAFVVGMISEKYLQVSCYHWLSMLLLSLLGSIAMNFVNPSTQWKYRWLSGLLILLILFSYAGIIHKIKTKQIPKEKSSVGCIYITKIIEEPKKTKAGVRYLASFYSNENKKYVFTSLGYIYVEKKTTISFKVGDIIVLNTVVGKIKNNGNPGAYNFALQSALKGIFYTTSLKDKTDYFWLGYEEKRFKSYILKVRQWIIQTLRDTLKDKDIAGLAEAMLIGYRDDIDQELLNSYINTGVVHVIAISGLHLSLIFLIIDFFVNLFLGKKRTEIAGLFITIPILWGFSIMTGGSASVIRSALMLTVVLIAKSINKKSNGINALLASAMILLIHSPEILYDIGFQLSYTAVASIMIFDPIIKKSIYVKNIIARKCWEMISITLSAQILTTPLTIFYFQQFPILFLFTNLVAVPLSSMILISELILCSTALVNISTKLPAVCTSKLIEWLNQYVQSMERVPFGMIKNIFIGIPTALTIYFLFFFLLIFFQKSSIQNFKNTLYAFLLLTVVHFIDLTNHRNKRRLLVLNIPGYSGFLFQKGSSAVFAANTTLFHDSKRVTNICNQIAAAYWIKNYTFKSFTSKPALIELDSHKILGEEERVKEKIILVLANSPKIKLNDLWPSFEKESILIADASNKLWKIRQWEKEADKLLLRFHSVAEEGPFVVEFKK